MFGMRAISAGLLLSLSLSAEAAVDYTDHGAICEAIVANDTAAWLIGQKERFLATTCPCEMKEYEKLLSPVEYRAVVAWRIDARAFAKNLPEGIQLGRFMSKVLPMGFKIAKTCN